MTLIREILAIMFCDDEKSRQKPAFSLARFQPPRVSLKRLKRYFGRLSITRRALPTERSMPFTSSTFTCAVTPISDLMS